MLIEQFLWQLLVWINPELQALASTLKIWGTFFSIGLSKIVFVSYLDHDAFIHWFYDWFMFIASELWWDSGNGCAAGEIKLCVSRHWMHLGSKVGRDKVSPKIHTTAAMCQCKSEFILDWQTDQHFWKGSCSPIQVLYNGREVVLLPSIYILITRTSTIVLPSDTH